MATEFLMVDLPGSPSSHTIDSASHRDAAPAAADSRWPPHPTESGRLSANRVDHALGSTSCRKACCCWREDFCRAYTLPRQTVKPGYPDTVEVKAEPAVAAEGALPLNYLSAGAAVTVTLAVAVIEGALGSVACMV